MATISNQKLCSNFCNLVQDKCTEPEESNDFTMDRCVQNCLTGVEPFKTTQVCNRATVNDLNAPYKNHMFLECVSEKVSVKNGKSQCAYIFNDCSKQY
jgi:hypothetical protein